MPERPSARGEIAELVGYHSPQVEVEVRLNTNESPVRPPAGFRDALADAVRGLEFNRYPDREAIDLRFALARRYSLDAAQVFPTKMFLFKSPLFSKLWISFGT